jgi:bifunctional ADP-heptose synthase (sugar kinase/adenylyltransferase)
LLAAFSFVDAIVLFSEQTPINLIAEIKPDILAKGGDYEIQKIVGHNIVQGNGGEVITIPLTEGFSSTNIIDKIQNG